VEAWREALALATVFSLLGAALWALRHRTGALRGGSAKSLTSVERLALTPQHALHLIRTSGRDLLIATHPHGCTLIYAGSPISDNSSVISNNSTLVSDNSNVISENSVLISDNRNASSPSSLAPQRREENA
jgi:hypothetical protein